MNRFRWLVIEPAEPIEVACRKVENIFVNPTLARMINAVDEVPAISVRRMVAAAFEQWTDKDICLAYQSIDGQRGNPLADLLAVAAEERHLGL